VGGGHFDGDQAAAPGQGWGVGGVRGFETGQAPSGGCSDGGGAAGGERPADRGGEGAGIELSLVRGRARWG
jgi:hypothetical protein